MRTQRLLLLFLLLAQISISQVTFVCSYSSSCSSGYSITADYGGQPAETVCTNHNCSAILGYEITLGVSECRSDDYSQQCSNGLCISFDRAFYCSPTASFSSCQSYSYNYDCGACRSTSCSSGSCLSGEGIELCFSSSQCLFQSSNIEQYTCSQIIGAKSCSCCNKIEYSGGMKQCSDPYGFDQQKLRGQAYENWILNLAVSALIVLLGIQ